jgi:hypothetical protein
MAATVTGEPAGAEAGGGCVMVTPVTVEMMVTEAEKLLLRSVEDRAFTVTVLCAGTASGAMKTVEPPLDVCAGEKEPQFGALAQVATQSTPSPAMSLATVAETEAVPPTVIEVGGACVMVRDMTGVSDCDVFAALAPQPAAARTTARDAKNERSPTKSALAK